MQPGIAPASASARKMMHAYAASKNKVTARLSTPSSGSAGLSGCFHDARASLLAMQPVSRAGPARLEQRRRRLRHRLRRRRIAVVVLIVLLAPVLYSYVATMTRPSSLPLSVRTVEWIRANHGAWLVDTVEHYWYSWNAPAPGGQALKKLPNVGIVVHGSRPNRIAVAPYRPRQISPLLHPALPLEGVWQATGQLVRGAPPVLVTTFRPDRELPAHGRLRRLDRSHENAARALPGPLRTAGSVSARPDGSASWSALEAARDLQQRLHVRGRPRRVRGRRSNGEAASGG